MYEWGRILAQKGCIETKGTYITDAYPGLRRLLRPLGGGWEGGSGCGARGRIRPQHIIIRRGQALKTTPADHQSAAEKGLIFVFSDFCAICAIAGHHQPTNAGTTTGGCKQPRGLVGHATDDHHDQRTHNNQHHSYPLYDSSKRTCMYTFRRCPPSPCSIRSRNSSLPCFVFPLHDNHEEEAEYVF